MSYSIVASRISWLGSAGPSRSLVVSELWQIAFCHCLIAITPALTLSILIFGCLYVVKAQLNTQTNWRGPQGNQKELACQIAALTRSTANKLSGRKCKQATRMMMMPMMAVLQTQEQKQQNKKNERGERGEQEEQREQED
jgi:hypothetical protein